MIQRYKVSFTGSWWELDDVRGSRIKRHTGNHVATLTLTVPAPNNLLERAQMVEDYKKIAEQQAEQQFHNVHAYLGHEDTYFYCNGVEAL